MLEAVVDSLWHALLGALALWASILTSLGLYRPVISASSLHDSMLANALELRTLHPLELFPGAQVVKHAHGHSQLWIFGPENGKRITLVCGLAIPAVIWRDVGLELARRGYRVLAYDLLGRGWSSAPNVKYTGEVYVSQLTAILFALGWQSTSLVGLSMGGPIAATFASLFPERVDKLILLAPAGLISPVAPAIPPGLPVSMLLRIVTRLRMAKKDPEARKSLSATIRRVPRLSSIVLPNFASAVWSSIVDGPISNQGELRRSSALTFAESNYRALAKVDVPVLIMHGTSDGVVPYSLTKHQLLKLLPRARLQTIPGAGHDLPVNATREVVDGIASFVDR